MKKFLLFVNIVFCTTANAQTIAAGNGHTVYICPNGSAVSAGRNNAGQLGWGQLIPNTNVTVDVQNLTGIAAVSAGDEHTLFLMEDGTVYACGRNWDGRLGFGNYTGTNVALQIPGLTDIIAVSAGHFHSLFLKSDGTVWATGDNYYGALGNGGTATSNVPVQVGISGVSAIAAGSYFSLFLKPNGEVWGCGYNQEGQLGTQNYNNADVPVQMVVSSVAKIAAGLGHSLMVKFDGTAWSCGRNDLGQLGLGGFGGGNTPTVLAVGLGSVSAISAGWGHSVFLTNGGSVYTVGDDLYGQLGNDALFEGNGYVQLVTGLSDIVEISAGGDISLFLKSDGTYYGCGNNDSGPLANGTNGAGNYEPEPLESTVSCTVTKVDETSQPSSLKLMCYPNPTSETALVNFGYSVTDAELAIINSMGQTIEILSGIHGYNITLETKNLSAGLYFLNLNDSNGTQSLKMIVQN